ncbi:hypothetical protein FQZ97_543520 [compost metagenome]
MSRKAVSVDPDQINIASAQGDAFVQQLDTLVDQHEKAAFNNFWRPNGSAGNPQRSGQALCQGSDLVVAFATSPIVEVEPAAGFLSIATHGVQFVAKAAIAFVTGTGRSIQTSTQVADVDPDQVQHAEHAHVQVQISESAVHLSRRRSF